jgi:preprotein translocase subunit YajC
LVAIIAGQVGKVIDVSAGGIRLELRGPIGRDITSFALYPRSGDRVALNNGIHARGIVVHEEGTHVGLRFQPATLALARFLADHIDAQD